MAEAFPTPESIPGLHELTKVWEEEFMAIQSPRSSIMLELLKHMLGLPAHADTSDVLDALDYRISDLLQGPASDLVGDPTRDELVQETLWIGSVVSQMMGLWRGSAHAKR
jgi:hypothetical protein